MLSLSKRSALIAQAEIRSMTIECEKVNGINLAQGVCDTEVPLPVRNAAYAAIDQGVNTYTRYDGLAELRRAIARKLRDYNNITADPDTDIIVSAGSTGALYSACLALLDPGDEVIVFEPYYGYHVSTLVAVEAVPVYVTMRPPEWTFEPRDLESAITPRTKGIIVNTPANPSGKVFSLPELECICELAIHHDLFVFTDEIYEYIVYDGHHHISPGSLPGMAERTITISGFSKTFSIHWMAGGVQRKRRPVGADHRLRQRPGLCVRTGAPSGGRRGRHRRATPGFYRQLSQDYLTKRDRICQSLWRAELPPVVPQGAYYVLADVKSLPGQTSKDKAMYLLSRAGVAGVPGNAFFQGSEGDGLVRFCFAKTDAELDEACRRIEGLR